MTVTVSVDRNEVLKALMRTTGYIGAKRIDTDKDAYRRISLTDDDMKLVERLWHESRDRLCMELRRQIDGEGMEGDTYRLDLNVSESYDSQLTATLQNAIAAYLHQSMAAKWLAITEKTEAAEFAAAASATLGDICRQIYCKRKPMRPRY